MTSPVGGTSPLYNTQNVQGENLPSLVTKFANHINTFANDPYNANATEFAKDILQLSTEAKSV